jgi:hypothetical protein
MISGDIVPLVQPSNEQACTFKQACEFLVLLNSKGIAAGNLRELQPNFELVAVPVDPRWRDDGQLHIYYYNLWGSPVDSTVALDSATLGAGGFSAFTKLFSNVFPAGSNPLASEVAAYRAVLALPGVTDAVDKLLTVAPLA